MTSTSSHCSICGAEGSWGRFGSHRGLYVRDSSASFVRVGWICPACLKKIEAFRLRFQEGAIKNDLEPRNLLLNLRPLDPMDQKRRRGTRRMMTLWCSHCGIPYKFTQEELTQLLIAGILYVDCLNCSNEIPLSSEPDSASS